MNVLTSKAEVSSFALELSKGLGMRYIAPSLPVELSLNTAVGDRIHSKSESEQAVENLMKVLESKKDK